MRVTAGLTITFTLLVPAAYFFLSYQYIVGSLDVQAETSARIVSGIVTANPETWRFEQVRLAELLERRPLTDAPQVRRILDGQGRIVAESVAVLHAPMVTRSRPIYDAGTAAGWVLIGESLRPLLYRTVAGAGITFLAGSLVFIMVVSVPMRAVEKTRRSLDESERRYRALYESMKEGVAVFRISESGGGNPAAISLLDANPSWKRMFGEWKAEPAGPDISGWFDGVLGNHLPEIVRRSRTGEGFSFEAGDSVRQRLFGASVFYPETGVFAILVDDQTEARKAREEREQMQLRFLHAQKLESLGILAGGIAHDFNNLLVGILGNIDLALGKAPPGSAVYSYIRQIELAALRAAELTNQMLAYSGRGRFVVERIDASRLVGEMEQLLSTVVSKSAIVRYELAAGLPPIEADATQIRQLVMNLITNASDAIRDGEGTIKVSTGEVMDPSFGDAVDIREPLPGGRYVYIEVADSGCGMDRETSDRIFEPFFTTKETGRGLGLAAALGIVRGHNGALVVRTAPGEGTTFRAVFPAAAAQRDVANPARTSPLPGGARPLGTILVVDDEESVRSVASEMLGQRGFAVLTASDGREGVELFRARSAEIAAVVLDVTMPRMGGEEAMRAMRRIAPDVPVILCSGYTEQDTFARLVSDSAAGFIQKPFRAQTLLNTVSEVVERRSGTVKGVARPEGFEPPTA